MYQQSHRCLGYTDKTQALISKNLMLARQANWSVKRCFNNMFFKLSLEAAYCSENSPLTPYLMWTPLLHTFSCKYWVGGGHTSACLLVISLSRTTVLGDILEFNIFIGISFIQIVGLLSQGSKIFSVTESRNT